ncbi:unnamed protein product [Coffea canephora]|uniref:H15 domain-containing protein n=1 Tax=Coffea canephora TaxID=49390 RepID=A0A068TS99_COFCA|nr:unnamed protein product [Coffea canephora]
MAPPSKTAAAGKPAKSPATKSAAAVKAKKAPAAKKVRSYPTYFEMIKEAIIALKERTGSSPYAIAKFIEEKQKDLPPNFKKLLSVQLKKLLASGKLIKVKNSFKLAAPVKPTTAAAAGEKKPKKAVAPKKEAAGTKRKRTANVEKKKPKVVAAVSAKVKKTPVKKAPVKKAVKKTPVKKPKSLKSPAKKLKK